MSQDTPDPAARMPPQIKYIIGNEGCERFSYYGMRNILTTFLPLSILLAYLPDKGAKEAAASDIFHTFSMGVYFFPLLGGWLSDRFFGKYNTIFWFSLIYCAGHGCLSAFEDSRTGFFFGLFLIAFGAGGIKPLVASFVGDQFDQRNKHLAKAVFDAFYWIINFGSFFASALMPLFLRWWGPSVAFAIPGVLMFIATVVFWIGRHNYVRIPPAPPNPNSFLRVSRTALFASPSKVGLAVAALGVVLSLVAIGFWVAGFLPLFKPQIIAALSLVFVTAFGAIGVSLELDRIRGKHSDEAIDGVRAVLRILIVFGLVTPFWSLFDQKASLWVYQGNTMEQPTWFEPAQMQLVNPALVMLIIPFNNLVVFPWLKKRRGGRDLTSLGRMTTGMALTGMSWIVIGAIQLVLDSGTNMWIFWQVVPYLLLTTGEVLVSATGLEFAYSQAPLAMKGAIMSFWNLTVAVGNLWVLLANTTIVKNATVSAKIESTGLSTRAFLMFFFAIFMFLATLAFRAYSRRYRLTEHYRDPSPAPAPPKPEIPKATARDRDR